MMEKHLGKGLATAAVTGILIGLAGCGGGTQSAAPTKTLGAEPVDAKEKDGCPGKPGENHACGAEHRRDDGQQPAPATPSTGNPAE